MEPTPETHEALEELSAGSAEPLEEQLVEMGDAVRRVVPAIIGLSLSYVEEGLTFTLVASDETIAALEAVQYVDDGPSVEAARRGDVVELTRLDPLDEARWHWFSRAGAASGVASTLSIPLLEAGRVLGGVTLYAATPDAFAGHHDDLARTFGGWAPGAVSNADLAFTSRGEAVETPGRLEDQARIDRATGIIMAEQGLDADQAATNLREAANRSGLTEAQVARAILEAHHE